MYKLERIQRRAIRVLYKLNLASIVSISDLMISLGWLKFRYIFIHRYCVLHIIMCKALRLYTVDFLNI